MTDPANPYVARPAAVLRGRRAAAARRRPAGLRWRRRPRPGRRSWSPTGCCGLGRPAGTGPVAAGRTWTSGAAAGRRSRSSRAATGRLLGTVDGDASHATVHTGRALRAPRRDVRGGRVRRGGRLRASCTRRARSGRRSPGTSSTSPSCSTDRTRRLGTVTAHTGVVDVTNQVVAYQRRRLGTGEVLAEFPLDLPPRQLRTRAVWFTLDERAVGAPTSTDAALPGSLHAAEHAAIGILPLLATCDRWDLGGVSTALHPDTGAATVVVYDGHPGGAGFAERGYAVLRDWLQATRATVASCECESGLPVLRAVAQVRQRQRPAGQGRGGAGARRGPRRARRRAGADPRGGGGDPATRSARGALRDQHPGPGRRHGPPRPGGSRPRTPTTWSSEATRPHPTRPEGPDREKVPCPPVRGGRRCPVTEPPSSAMAARARAARPGRYTMNLGVETHEPATATSERARGGC